MNHRKLRGLRWVRRFNFHRCNHYQSVAEHSYFVALLGVSISYFTGEDREVVLRQALLHDATEAVTGDVPYLMRRRMDLSLLEYQAAAELGVSQIEVVPEVLLADAIELKMYLEEERGSGNLSLIEIEEETMGRIWELVRAMRLYENKEFQEWMASVIHLTSSKPETTELLHGHND